MLSASFRSRAGRDRSSFRRRFFALLLAILVEGLLVVVLLTLNARQNAPEKLDRDPLSFQLIPAPEKGGGNPAPEPSRAARGKPQPKSVVEAPAPLPPVVPPPQPAPPPKADPFPDLVRVDKDTLASADIGRIAPSRTQGADGPNAGKDSAAAYGPGAGPGGEPLYNAEWVREPTKAELAFYLPPIKESGWALIACKTVPGNRVDNCRTMGESPLGSGLSRGFREAAWQFRVYPPRIGGKPIIGAWVRIYYQLTVTKAKS